MSWTPHEGEVNNRHKAVTDRHGVPVVHLSDDDTEWTIYEPKGPMAVLNEIYPNGIKIPKILVGKNIVHLPTVKTHVFTTITGAMKNAFGGLLHFDRHWTHSVIHKTLGDLLTIQKEIHPGLLAVMDGTFAGDGPGPRAMRPHIKNIILASTDMVAIDAISAKIQGFDPMSLEFIASAHERGLGTGDPREIEVVGADVSEINWHFRANEETIASRGQKMIYWGPLKPLENFLLRSPIAPWSFFASMPISTTTGIDSWARNGCARRWARNGAGCSRATNRRPPAANRRLKPITGRSIGSPEREGGAPSISPVRAKPLGSPS